MNPETYPYCNQCPNYEAVAQFHYELSSPAKRRCRHLCACKRVADYMKRCDHGQQLSLFSQAKQSNE